MGLGRLWIALGTGLAATLLWNFELLQPVKLLIVLVHEFWHGAVALLSGAMLDRISVRFDEGGETLVRGLYSAPGFLLTVSAGYIGTTVTGAFLLNRGLAARYERLTLFAFAAILLYMSYLFTTPGEPAFFTGIGWSLGFAVLAAAGALTARLTLIVFGVLCLWYCVYDLLDFTREITRTDAGILAIYMQAQNWPLADSVSVTTLAGLISIVWTVLSLAALALTLAPAIFSRPPAPAPASVSPPPPDPAFPGELTPEVQNWLIDNGFGLDGRPLPPELMNASAPGALQSPPGETKGAELSL